MAGEKNLNRLISGMRPVLNGGSYVFCSLKDCSVVNHEELLGLFREREGVTVIVERGRADALGLAYDYIASWITLTIHSSLDAVGLTAAVSKALSEANISCNVVAAYYHDHVFVAQADAERAVQVLEQLAG